MQDRQKKSYTCTFRYTVELAAHCNAVTNAAIAHELDRLNLFDPTQHILSEEDVCAAIDESTAVPDWARAMAGKAFGEMNFPALAGSLATARIEQMRSLLGQPQVIG